jgi:crotonobetainyl-CoA:carnitine CoA-transferase CaiB-like acyl-CoA transferase
MGGPLDGFSIIELTSTVSGPIAGMILGDQGADIIKIEPPGIGDLARYMGDISNGMAAMYATLNRNKRSLTLDLKDPADMELFKQLVSEADVLIENYRPGIVQKLGIDYDTLCELNPKLIYTSISGYGQSGPYMNRRVYDPLVQATSGTSAEQNRGRADNVRTVIFDKVTGYTAAQAITAALLQRSRTGEGQYLPISMLQSALYYQWPDVMWSRTWQNPEASHSGTLADYFQVYSTADGYIAVILVTDDAFQQCCELVSCKLHEESRFATFAQRLQHLDALRDSLDEAFAKWPTEKLCEALDELNIPVAKVNTLDELFTDAQVLEQNSIVERTHPVGGDMKLAETPFHFDGQPPLGQRPAATLGQHSGEILRELNVDESQIERIEKRDAAMREAMAGMSLSRSK